MVVMTLLPDTNLARNMDTTFVEAIKSKYDDQEDFDDCLTIPKDNNVNTEITLVGFGRVLRRQRNLENLINVDLSYNKISSLGNLNELGHSLIRVQILNISGNLLTSWTHVIELIARMPALQELIVSTNPIDWSTHDSCQVSDYISQRDLRVPSVRQVTMGGMAMESWEKTISILSSVWDTVESLDLYNNALEASEIHPPTSLRCQDFLSSLKSIALSENSIGRILQLKNFGHLKSLEELDVSKCALEEITLDDKLETMFVNLQRLNISLNKINSWRSIAELNKLRSLQFLICHGNPIISPSKITKMMVVGRIGNLISFNREEIPKPQRRDSELFYMRKLFEEYLNYKDGKNDTFLLDNPRYEELLSIYGMPEDLKKVVLIKNYLNINIQHKLSGRIISKKLPCHMPIGNFKMLSKRLFGLSPSSGIQLMWSPKDKNMSCELDKDAQGLSFYSIQDEDTIVIEEP